MGRLSDYLDFHPIQHGPIGASAQAEERRSERAGQPEFRASKRRNEIIEGDLPPVIVLEEEPLVPQGEEILVVEPIPLPPVEPPKLEDTMQPSGPDSDAPSLNFEEEEDFFGGAMDMVSETEPEPEPEQFFQPTMREGAEFQSFFSQNELSTNREFQGNIFEDTGKSLTTDTFRRPEVFDNGAPGQGQGPPSDLRFGPEPRMFSFGGGGGEPTKVSPAVIATGAGLVGLALLLLL